MIEISTPVKSVTIVVPRVEEITAENAANFRRSVCNLIDMGHSRLVIDLGQVQAVDSSGIGALVGLLKRVGLRGDVALCQVGERVARRLAVTRMDRIFAIHSDSARAVEALAA